MELWENVLLATAGAAVVLAGLIFVAASNLTKILDIPKMPNPTSEALFLLMAA